MSIDFSQYVAGATAWAAQLNLLFVVLSVAGVLCVLAAVTLVLVAPLRHALAEQGRLVTTPWLPLVWAAIPTALVLVVFLWSINIQTNAVVAADDCLNVGVGAKQWMWTFDHEEGPSEIGELHVPLGVPVRLWFSSEDVFHRFSVPSFRIQEAVLPGRVTETVFRATRTGAFRLQCTDYCGAEHARMSGTIYVQDPIEYEHWVTGDAGDLTPEQAGERLYSAFRCASCHLAGGKGTGPALDMAFGSEIALSDGSSVLLDEDYLRESILAPNAKIANGYQPVMPSYQTQLSETDVAQLIAFLKSTAADAGNGADQ